MHGGINRDTNITSLTNITYANLLISYNKHLLACQLRIRIKIRKYLKESDSCYFKTC